ncbi:nuclear transport factor 2 family protein [Aliikangiella sp. G2MR2-5]|uniref:YybH family protein n=1 Tax=Aliikangiella sp. G2MR2-5 TaxID=2788943 RepID=UPI0018AA1B23|nr:nuclear transport factor 2 family protein [Aliikangiella sp. G2MR2-5]
MQRLKLTGALISLYALTTAVMAESTTHCDFECTLSQHLQAIQTKDFEAFEKTITPEAKLTFILPNGKYFDDSAEYRQMLKEWFKQDGWTFNFKVISKYSSNTFGHALLLIDYNEADRGGKPYHLDHYLSLIFEKQGSHWYLIHDQNTKTDLSPKGS